MNKQENLIINSPENIKSIDVCMIHGIGNKSRESHNEGAVRQMQQYLLENGWSKEEPCQDDEVFPHTHLTHTQTSNQIVLRGICWNQHVEKSSKKVSFKWVAKTFFTIIIFHIIGIFNKFTQEDEEENKNKIISDISIIFQILLYLAITACYAVIGTFLLLLSFPSIYKFNKISDNKNKDRYPLGLTAIKYINDAYFWSLDSDTKNKLLSEIISEINTELPCLPDAKMLIGHSQGGSIAHETALRYSGKLNIKNISTVGSGAVLLGVRYAIDEYKEDSGKKPKFLIFSFSLPIILLFGFSAFAAPISYYFSELAQEYGITFILPEIIEILLFLLMFSFLLYVLVKRKDFLITIHNYIKNVIWDGPGVDISYSQDYVSSIQSSFDTHKRFRRFVFSGFFLIDHTAYYSDEFYSMPILHNQILNSLEIEEQKNVTRNIEYFNANLKRSRRLRIIGCIISAIMSFLFFVFIYTVTGIHQSHIGQFFRLAVLELFIILSPVPPFIIWFCFFKRKFKKISEDFKNIP